MNDAVKDASPDAERSMTPLKRAFLALEETRARLAAAEAAQREPIAIIGLGCRVPGGGNEPASFWALMRDGVDAIGPLPADRWDVEALHDPDPEVPGRIATRAGGFLGDVRGFDPGLFGITRREAQGMDPQQRLFLEVAWEALEHAGQPPDRLQHSPTGVYLGVTGSDYAYLQFESRDRELLDAHFASGIAHSIASGRLSYLLGLQGPALTIDTACSSSLVAVHLACQALRAGDCAMALAGGVNLILSPDLYIALSRARMLAPDGRCKTFDAAADGFARGEGCGVVVLKKLADARADGDRVLAIIRGSALNQDGPSSGMTAPNGPAQEAVIREALARADVAPREVGYVEAHGTGTQLGDPLELQALGAVFGNDREPGRPLLVGSVKTNIGHLEAAAGVTGLIKLVLSLRQQTLPAHLHLHQRSPHIDWDELSLQVPTETQPWQPIGGRRIAGVSSFGFSGTNAHVVVEESVDPPASAVATPGPLRAFVLSARDEPALAEMARRYLASTAGLADAALADLCFSAATGRAQLPQRAVVLAADLATLRDGLLALAEGREVPALRRSRVQRRDPARIAFLFTGQGAQYAGMAAQLDRSQPVFRAALDRCAAVLDSRLPRPLRDLLFGGAPGDTSLDQTACTQPALFAVEYALAALWRSWGVQPDMLMGHSVGEVVAACLAGVLQLEDALTLIAERGRQMQALPAGGAMAAVFAAADDVLAAVEAAGPALSVAAHNGPLQTVVSGDADAVARLCAGFESRGVRCQPLPVSHAFHSARMAPMLDAFEATVAGLSLAPPTLRLVSNLSGDLADPREIVQPRYWRRHVRETVRFADGMRTLIGLRPDVCLEIGPHPTLLAFAQANLEELPAPQRPQLVASLRKGRDDESQLADALASLFLAGVAIDWRAVWSATPCRRLDLPAYAFQREPLWFSARPAVSAAAGTGHPLLGVRRPCAQPDTLQFEQLLRRDSLPFLDEHRVLGRAILPATGTIEMALSAGAATLRQRAEIAALALLEPLAFVEDESRTVQCIVRREGEGAEFTLWSRDAQADADAAWTRHAQARLRPAGPARAAEPLSAARERCRDERSGTAHRALLAERGLQFGPSLHGVRRLWVGQREALGEIELPAPAISGRGDFQLHPALLDACLQVLAAAVPAAPGGRAYLPLAVEHVGVMRQPSTPVWSHARVVDGGRSETLHAELDVFDAQGLFAQMRGIALRPAAAATPPVPAYRIAWDAWVPDHADWLPALPALDAALAGRLATLLAEHGMDDYDRAFVALEPLCRQWVASALKTLGWQPRVGETVLAPALADRLGVLPRYRRLLGRLLDILAEDGWLARDGAAWRVERALAAPEPASLTRHAEELQRAHPTSATRIEFVRRCGPALAGVLAGREDPLQLLFPDGSSELAESLYRDAPEARAWNQLVRDAVLAAAATLPAGRRLRILEVGGGTGGTTAWVAPALDAGRCNYLFTDVGPSLVQRARDRFARHGFITFQTLDLELEPASQGLAGRHFDLIIASNVVHATRDLRNTLGRLRGLLAPGGTLLMLEVAGMERWIDLSFGLTEGWWAFEDASLRRDYPLLDRPAWLALLTSLGFESAAIGGQDARSREVLLAARRPVVQAAPPGHWLLLGEGAGLASTLAAALTAGGQTVEQLDCAAADADGLRDRVAACAAGLAGVVHLGALDLAAPSTDMPESLMPGQQAVLGSLLAVVQGLGRTAFDAAAPRLVLVTQGAVPATGSALVRAEQAAATGLARVIALEHPELRPLRVDLDPLVPAATQAAAVWERLCDDGDEDQFARRAGAWQVPRLQPLVVREAEDAPVRLEKDADGVLDRLHLRSVERRAPGPGEVEIRVAAAGLNFRDVMNAVAMREDPEPLGGECAGRVVAVGPGVSTLAPGDHVVALAEASFASFATASAALTRRLPEGIGFDEAVTLPFAFMTALHALFSLGGLSRGETVLIHAGTGGVGMAALQLARACGARVLATAGNAAKRERLLSLGAEAVFDSRSLDFADQVLAHTGGGVDVLLNSLSGEFIGASVRCLAARGRFLEIGKRDIWSQQRFAAERPDGRYHAIDLARMRHEDTAGTAGLFDEVMRRAATGEIRPLPLHAFALEQAAEAFRFMAMARHVGKVVLTRADAHPCSLDSLDPSAAYLVTGGLSGLGLLTAQRLAERGARHLVLVGRRPPTAEAETVLATLRDAGTEVRTIQTDLAEPGAVQGVLSRIDPRTPLRGIVHSAGLLDDGALVQQRWERFVRPLGPKVDGTWALHVVTRHCRLDFFVMYSSVAATLGSRGQGNHAAANAFMDALAAQRRVGGAPALSIGWGAWSEVGAAAERQVDTRIGERGIGAISPRQGMEWLEMLMRSDAPAHLAVLPVRWNEFFAAGATLPLLSALRASEREPASLAPAAKRADAGLPAWRGRLDAAAPTQRGDLLLGFVGEQVAQVIGATAAEAIDPRQPLNELGLDSLMAVDLRNRLGAGLELSRSLPATLVFDHPTLQALADYLAQDVLGWAAPTDDSAGVAAADAVGAIDELSDEEIEQLFAKKLRRP
ncbi:MAG: SDR family NAD(P)-dependent oxidoreductase [Piscinibacter sp.]|uniref:SDR family NAD(P)-dependent oxidoreductase n=1 Tax=Piscinibacter sp. TaxID=1903157 RepID=UPI003D0B7B26